MKAGASFQNTAILRSFCSHLPSGAGCLDHFNGMLTGNRDTVERTLFLRETVWDQTVVLHSHRSDDSFRFESKRFSLTLQLMRCAAQSCKSTLLFKTSLVVARFSKAYSLEPDIIYVSVHAIGSRPRPILDFDLITDETLDEETRIEEVGACLSKLHSVSSSRCTREAI